MQTGGATQKQRAESASGGGRSPSLALEPRMYFDPAVAALEDRAIFSRTWQLAGHVSDLPDTGSWLTARAGSQSAIVVRGKDGALRAFRNVCRHRGRRLMNEATGCSKALRCAYHGWTYGLDGSLLGAPEIRGFGDRLDRPSFGLHEVRVEELCGLVFINLDLEATPLAEQVEGLPERLARYDIPSLERASGGADTTQPANWKVVADNYLEGYHIPLAHPSLMRLLDYEYYQADIHHGYTWVEAPMRGEPSENRAERLYQRYVEPMGQLTDADRHVWRYLFIYPNTALDLYPDQVGYWQIHPETTETTRDVYALLRPRSQRLRSRLVRGLNNRLNDLVNDEDLELVQAVQRGLHTDGYRCGPLNIRESAVGWFADRIRADLAANDEERA